MTIILFFKIFKIWCRFQKWQQKSEKKFFVIKIIPFESGTTYSLNLEKDTWHSQPMCYETSLRVNISLGDIFLGRFSQSDEKIWWKCSYADFSSVWHHSTCWLSKSVLKLCFLESALTKSFTAWNFRNKVAITIIIFFKMFKIWCRLQKWNENIRKRFHF